MEDSKEKTSISKGLKKTTRGTKARTKKARLSFSRKLTTTATRKDTRRM